MSQSLQLDMNFDGKTDNRLRSALEAGIFTVLVEASLPEDEISRQGAAERLAILEKSVLECSKENLNTALAITDYSTGERRWRGAEFATFLPKENRDAHVVYISGYDTDMKQSEELFSIACDAGFCNIVPVSGAVPQPRSVKECRKTEFTESTQMLRAFADRKNIFCGLHNEGCWRWNWTGACHIPKNY